MVLPSFTILVTYVLFIFFLLTWVEVYQLYYYFKEPPIGFYWLSHFLYWFFSISYFTFYWSALSYFFPSSLFRFILLFFFFTYYPRWKLTFLVLDLDSFIICNMCIECYKFPSKYCFHGIPQILIICIFIFIKFRLFFNISWHFLFDPFVTYRRVV